MEDWVEKKFSELGTIVGGATPSTKVESNYKDGEIPWITPKDLAGFRGRYIERGERNITKQGLESCSAQMMPANTVLFTSRAPIGYVAIAKNPVCTNQGFKSIIPNKETDYLFLYYLLKHNKQKIESLGSGTTFKEVSGYTMKNIAVSVPRDKGIQEKIGRILSSIDDKIEENEIINHNLEQQASALVGRYMKSTDTSVSFADIMGFDSGFPFQSSTYLPSGKYRIITIKNVQDGYIETSNTAFLNNLPTRMKNNCILHVGDVLLSLTGNVGRVGLVCEKNLLLNQRVAKIVPKYTELLPLLYFILRQPDIKTQMELIAKGTAQPNLSPVETLNLTIPFERETAEALSQTLAPMYQTIISTTQENHSLSSLRDTLLPRLMNGEINVSDMEI